VRLRRELSRTVLVPKGSLSGLAQNLVLSEYIRHRIYESKDLVSKHSLYSVVKRVHSNQPGFYETIRQLTDSYKENKHIYVRFYKC